jgi:hypothetical protein
VNVPVTGGLAELVFIITALLLGKLLTSVKLGKPTMQFLTLNEIMTLFLGLTVLAPCSLVTVNELFKY